jgi:hypothetical protein
MSDETVNRQGPVSTSAPGTWQPTEEEIVAGMDAIGDGTEQGRSDVQDILAAVGPAIHETGYNQGGQKGMEEGYAIGYQEGARDALWEAADDLKAELDKKLWADLGSVYWLRARADRLEAP